MMAKIKFNYIYKNILIEPVYFYIDNLSVNVHNARINSKPSNYN